MYVCVFVCLPVLSDRGKAQHSTDTNTKWMYKHLCVCMCKCLNNMSHLGEAWVNINKGTDINKAHTHGGSHVSGALYLKNPSMGHKTDGNILFLDPRSTVFKKYLNLSFGEFEEVLSLLCFFYFIF